MPFVCLAVLLCASGVRADIIPGSQKNVSGWAVFAFNAQDGSFSECLTLAKYPDGAVVSLTLTARATGSIGWAHPSWNLRPGQQVPIRLAIDANGPFAMTAVAQDKSRLTVDLPPTTPLFSMVSSGSVMTLQVPGGHTASTCRAPPPSSPNSRPA